MSMSVCWSVCLSASISRTHVRTFTKFSVYVACGRGLVLLWPHCNTLCTSGSWMTSCFSTMSPTAMWRDHAATSLQCRVRKNYKLCPIVFIIAPMRLAWPRRYFAAMFKTRMMSCRSVKKLFSRYFHPNWFSLRFMVSWVRVRFTFRCRTDEN